MERTASAVWNGGLKDGKGVISTQSGVLNQTQYSFGTRFENGVGTNPEELIAAAHAGCFTMALSAQLGQANLTPESLDTNASVKFEKTDARLHDYRHTSDYARQSSRSERVSVSKRLPRTPRRDAPISRLFKGNTEISLDAKRI